MPKVCDIGDLMRVDGFFYRLEDDVKIPNDPTLVGVIILNPQKVATTFEMPDVEIVRDDTGYYHIDVSAEMHGRYYYYWYSTGIGQASGEDYFVVRESVVLKTIEELV